MALTRCTLFLCIARAWHLSVLVKPCSEDRPHRLTSSSEVRVARIFIVRFQGLASWSHFLGSDSNPAILVTNLHHLIFK